MTLSEDLLWRGLVKDKTFGDDAWLDEPKTFYHGVDCSGDSLTIGNLAALLLARRFADYGWKTVILVGGATSLVGDPGGKSEERELKEKSEIEHNVESVKAQIEKLFTGKEVIYVNNADWFSSIGYLDFLRDVGKHYSMTELVQRDYIADRMNEGGSGISYAEFSYTLIQGYDFWHLFKNHGAVLQIGGSDQWGNMLSGVPLIRKKENAEAHVMTMPLVIDKNTGVKFGKSEDGAIWLDAQKTSPYQFYQFWLNTDDDSSIDYLKIYTFLDKAQIEQVMLQHRQNPSERMAQKALAFEVTKIVHGEEEAKKAEDYAGWVSGASVSPSAPPEGSPSSYKLHKGISLVEAMVATGLASSNSDARRVLDEGGVYVNDKATTKPTLDDSDLVEGWLILRRGKKLQNSVAVELE